MKPIIAGQVEAVAGHAQSPSIRWALAGLSLATLLSSLGTSSANVALPTLAQAFGASFQQQPRQRLALRVRRGVFFTLADDAGQRGVVNVRRSARIGRVGVCTPVQ